MSQRSRIKLKSEVSDNYRVFFEESISEKYLRQLDALIPEEVTEITEEDTEGFQEVSNHLTEHLTEQQDTSPNTQKTLLNLVRELDKACKLTSEQMKVVKDFGIDFKQNYWQAPRPARKNREPRPRNKPLQKTTREMYLELVQKPLFFSEKYVLRPLDVKESLLKVQRTKLSSGIVL